MRKTLTTITLAIGLVIGGSATASAEPISPDPTHVPRTWHPKVGGPISPSPTHVHRTWHPAHRTVR